MSSNICLNMIVKDETPVLGRLFESLRSIIDYYIIVDTGSTDGTPEFIEKKMQALGIQGEVHRRPWIDFGHNRNEALQLVYKKRDHGWVLFIDADEELAFSDPLFHTKLTPGVSYQLSKHHGDIRYALPNLPG
jgi:glycosyltransferase involved in cell wall biosynthesis